MKRPDYVLLHLLLLSFAVLAGCGVDQGHVATQKEAVATPKEQPEKRNVPEAEPQVTVFSPEVSLSDLAPEDRAFIDRWQKEYGDIVKSLDPDKRTSLIVAAEDQSLALIEYLVFKGADVNATDSQFDTPLHNAVRNKNKGVIKYLVSQGANINAKNEWGGTPIYQALRDLDVLKSLVSQGADVNVKAMNGSTPVHHAASGNNVEILKYLVTQGADTHALDNNGETPLHYAARNSQEIQVVGFLRADGHVKNRWGQTPLDLARSWRPISGRNRDNDGFIRSLGGHPDYDPKRP